MTIATVDLGLDNRARIVRASRSFKLAGRPVPEFPIVIMAGAVVLPINSWLTNRAKFSNSSVGTLADEAYVLRDWWNWLRKNKVEFDQPDDDLVLRWIRTMEQERIWEGRIQHKVNLIYRFYEFCQTSLGKIRLIRPSSRGPEASDGTVKYWINTRFSYSTIPVRKTGGRPTPSSEEAEQIAGHLSRHPDLFVGARDWFCTQWMIKSGLRRQGVSRLTIETFEKSLVSENIITPHTKLELISRDHLERKRISKQIYNLVDEGRENFLIEVTEKFSKTRRVPVPIGFFMDNLNFIFDLRDKFLRANQISFAAAGGALWISKKTKTGMSAKSIGDIIKRAFKSTSIPGSAHRLRATFAYNLVYDLYVEAIDKHGQAFDPRVILDLAAEILGHTDPSTLKPYLTRARREYMLISPLQR